MSVTNMRVRTTSASAKPASASARSMIVEGRPRLGRDVARVAATGRRARRRSCRRPSTRRRRRSPGCSRRRPPTDRPSEIRRRSVTIAGVAIRAVARPRARRGPPGRPRSRAAARPGASSAARSSRPRGTRPARGRCRRSGRGRRGSGRPSRPSCWRRTRRRSTRRDLEPERRRDRLGVLDEPAAALELLHRPPAGHRLELDGRVGHLRRLGDPPDLGLGDLERVRAVAARTSTSSDAPLGDDVRARPAGDHARR